MRPPAPPILFSLATVLGLSVPLHAAAEPRALPFQWAVSLPAGDSQPMTLASGDFNADGRTDLAIGSFGPTRILRDTGLCTFATTDLVDMRAMARLSGADLNEDGRTDLFGVALAGAGIEGLFSAERTALAQPGGGFQVTTQNGHYSYPGAIAIADFYGDRGLDTAVTSDFANTAGSVRGVPIFISGAPDPAAMVAVQLGGNSQSELVVVGSTGEIVTGVTHRSTGPNGITEAWQAHAVGDLLPDPALRLFNATMAHADVDSDGDADVLVAYHMPDAHTGVLQVLAHSLSTPAALAPQPAVALPGQPLTLLAGEFDGDGHLDLLAGYDADGGAAFLQGDGMGHFAAGLAFPGPASGHRIEGFARLDCNADGRTDLAVLDAFSRKLHVYTGLVLTDRLLRDGFE